MPRRLQRSTRRPGTVAQIRATCPGPMLKTSESGQFWTWGSCPALLAKRAVRWIKASTAVGRRHQASPIRSGSSPIASAPVAVNIITTTASEFGSDSL